MCNTETQKNYCLFYFLFRVKLVCYFFINKNIKLVFDNISHKQIENCNVNFAFTHAITYSRKAHLYKKHAPKALKMHVRIYNYYKNGTCIYIYHYMCSQW